MVTRRKLRRRKERKLKATAQEILDRLVMHEINKDYYKMLEMLIPEKGAIFLGVEHCSFKKNSAS